MKKNYISKTLVISFVLALLLIASQASASFITPTLIYIQEGRTYSSISITNITDEAQVFTFEWERRVRSIDGKEVRLLKDGETDPVYRPADPYIIFSPRKVVIQPGKTQRVRLLARRPKDMPPGEYRSHLKITPDTAQIIEKELVDQGNFGGTFKIRPAVSIPVMLRTGRTTIDIAISSASLGKDGALDMAHINLANRSTRSVYGASRLKCVTAGGQEIIGESKRFRLYYESKTSYEKFEITGDVTPDKCSSLTLELYAPDEPGYKDATLASVRLK